MDRYLLIVTLMALLIMIYAMNIYLDTYSMLLQTEIKATIKEAGFEGEKLLVKISIKIKGKGRSFTPERLRYDLWLNRKYIAEDIIEELPTIKPDQEILIERTLEVPQERMFTVREAIESKKWSWRISGSILVLTFHGETILRFEGEAELPPISH